MSKIKTVMVRLILMNLITLFWQHSFESVFFNSLIFFVADLELELDLELEEELELEEVISI